MLTRPEARHHSPKIKCLRKVIRKQSWCRIERRTRKVCDKRGAVSGNGYVCHSNASFCPYHSGGRSLIIIPDNHRFNGTNLAKIENDEIGMNLGWRSFGQPRGTVEPVTVSKHANVVDQIRCPARISSSRKFRRNTLDGYIGNIRRMGERMDKSDQRDRKSNS